MSDLVTVLLLAGYPALAVLAGRALWAARRPGAAGARPAPGRPGRRTG